MDAMFAFPVLTTLAPSNLYVFSDVSLKCSPVSMTAFSKLLKVVWTENPLLDLLKVVWNGKPLLFGHEPESKSLESVDFNRKANAKAEKEGPAA